MALILTWPLISPAQIREKIHQLKTKIMHAKSKNHEIMRDSTYSETSAINFRLEKFRLT